MKLTIAHQEYYSRGELLLRSLFGPIYIMLPHLVMLTLFGLWASVIGFVAFWVLLFTGRYPESMYEYQVKLRNWSMRLNASLYNLVDGYPALGIDSTSENVQFDMPYPEDLSRGLVLVKALFGQLYVVLPHAICLYVRLLATAFYQFLAFWAVLFTGSYPESWHEFNVGTLRWQLRLDLYMNNMTDEYPPFSGKEIA